MCSFLKKGNFFLSHRNFVIGGNLLQGFRSFHKQSRPGPLNVQQIQELLAENIEKEKLKCQLYFSIEFVNY